MEKIVQLPSQLFQFILYFLSPLKKYVWLIIFFTALLSITTPVDAYISRYLIDSVSSGNFSQGQVLFFVLLFVAFWEFTNIGWRINDYLFLKIIPNVKSEISRLTTSYILNHSHKFFQENFAGSISNKISDLSRGVTTIFEHALSLFYQFTMVISSIVVIYTANPDLSIIFICWIIAFLCINIYSMRYIEYYSNIFAKSRSHTFGKIVDIISNVSSVKIFSHRKFETKFLQKILNETSLHDVRLRKCELIVNYMKGFISNILIGVMIYYLCSLYLEEKVTLGDFSLILIICNGLASELWNINKDIGIITEEIGICNQALQLINQPIEISDSTAAQDLNVKAGEIEFKNVNFQYLKDNYLFHHLSVKIASGSKVGLVGYSGSGKTSFINLIIRLFDINSGEILIDGQNISLVTQKSLRRNISYIPQDPSLFHRTLMENIRYGKLDASDEEVINAAKLAHAHEFILQTEFGYQSLTGERGIKLSGGQKQRIAIARAILKNSPILILDEATSALDSHTEQCIQESLDLLMRGKTTIVIAHRLSTLLNMDRILVFDRGKIVEDGSHTELIASNGLYKTLWESQVGGFLPDKQPE